MAQSPNALSPREAFARIQQAALGGDGGLAELYAPDAVHEWPFPFPGASRRLSGRPAIEDYFQRMRAGGGRFRFERFDNVVVHDTTDPEVIVVEYDIHGTVAATDHPFAFSYVLVMRVHDGQITHVRDYLDPLAMTRIAGAPPPGVDQAGPAPAPPAGHTDLLTRPLFARVATVRPDGAPQNSVMWFAWDGTHLKLAHSRRGQKYRNITTDPRVSVSLADPDDPYRSLEVRGTVTSITADAGAAFFTDLAHRYGHSGRPIPNPEHRVVLSVRPVAFTTSGPAKEPDRPL